MHKKRIGCAEAGVFTSVIASKKETEDSAERKMIVGSGETFRGQRVQEMVRSVRKSAEPRDSRHNEKRTILYGFTY